MKRTLPLFALAALILGLTWSTAFPQGAETQKTKPPVAAGPNADPTAFIPPDVDVLFKVDVAETLRKLAPTKEKQQEMTRKFIEMQKKDPAAAAIYEALDIDLSSDIKSMALGILLDPNNADNSEGLFAMKSNLTLDKIAKALKEKAADSVTLTPFEQDGYKCIEIDNKNKPGSKKAYLTSKGDVLLGSSSTARLKAALDTEKSGSSALASGQIAKGLSLTDKSAQVVMIFSTAKIPADKRKGGMLPGMEDIQLFAGSLKFANDSYLVNMVAQFSDPNNAQTLSQMLAAYKGMMASNADMKPLLDKITIAAQGTDLKVDASVTEKEFQDLMDKMDKKKQAPPPAQVPMQVQ